MLGSGWDPAAVPSGIVQGLDIHLLQPGEVWRTPPQMPTQGLLQWGWCGEAPHLIITVFSRTTTCGANWGSFLASSSVFEAAVVRSLLVLANNGKDSPWLSLPRRTGTGSCPTTPSCRVNCPLGVEEGYLRASPWMQDTEISFPGVALANSGQTSEIMLPESKRASVSFPAIFI